MAVPDEMSLGSTNPRREKGIQFFKMKPMIVVRGKAYDQGLITMRILYDVCFYETFQLSTQSESLNSTVTRLGVYGAS